jgi:spore coat-associated protein N
VRVKTKIGLSIASASLGLALISGATFAFFSDKAETAGSFVNGTLDLNANPTTEIKITDFKPGDLANRTIVLGNNGSLDIASVALATDYTVNNKEGAAANTEDLAKYIKVNFLDKHAVVQFSTTLDQLKNATPNIIGFLDEQSAIKPANQDNFRVQFQFIDSNTDQNQFQGDGLDIKFTFEGKQGAGVEH